jgi:hypothetical protein
MPDYSLNIIWNHTIVSTEQGVENIDTAVDLYELIENNTVTITQGEDTRTITVSTETKQGVLLYIQLRNNLIIGMCEYDTTDLSFADSSIMKSKQELLNNISYLLLRDIESSP